MIPFTTLSDKNSSLAATSHSFGIIAYRKISSLLLSPLCTNLPRGKTTPGRRSPRRCAVDVAADTDTDFHRRDAAVRFWEAVLGLVRVCKAVCRTGVVYCEQGGGKAAC